MKFNRFSTLYLLGAVALAGGCQQQDIEGIDNGSEVNLSVEVSKPYLDSSTRTALTENNKGNLDCVWTANDNLVVTDLSGVQKGILTLMNGYANKDHGLFDGTVSGVGDGEQTLNFYYLGVNNLGHVAGTNRTLDFSSQRGSEASLGDNDLLSASCKVNVDGKSAYAENISLLREVAFGSFQLNLPEGVDAVGKTVTVKGENVYSSATLAYANGGLTSVEGNISVTVQPGNEFFLTLIPGQDGTAITLNFEVTVDDITYTGTPGQRVWKKGEYVRQDLGNGTFGGIEVEMTQVGGEKPTPAIDDTVGPVFTINGKKFKFTKANLAYNIANQRWYLLDEQYSFLNKTGWEYLNGTWYKDKDKTTDIDLFGFGATGLFDPESGEYANSPQFYHKSNTNGTDGHYDGTYYPTQNSTVNRGQDTGTYLQYGIQKTVFDWGTAYGRQENNGDVYFTLLSSDWTALKNNYFFAAASISSTGYDKGTGYVHGCLIFPEKSSSSALELLKSVNPVYLNESKVSSSNLGFTGSNYTYFDPTWIRLTFEQFNELEELGVVFLPAAGSRAISSTNTNEGYYWTATAGQQYTSTYFGFNGISSPKKFQLNGSSTRSYGCSVRLVKEVTE